jgi:hypothetical protein
VIGRKQRAGDRAMELRFALHEPVSKSQLELLNRAYADGIRPNCLRNVAMSQ